MQAERNKQQYFLVNEAQAAAQAAAAQAAAGSYSSAARITAATSKPPTASQTGLSRQDAPAVIISERDRQTQMAAAANAMKMLTAQNIIDHVITQSIQGGSSGTDGIKIPQTKEELELVQASLVAKAQHEKLEEMKAAAAAAQHAAVVSASQSQQRSQIHELQVAQAQAQAQAQAHAQAQAAHAQAQQAAQAAQQGSSSKPNLPADMMLNRELSITPAPPSTVNEDYMKKRQILITTSATLTPTSSAAAPTRVSDERQIIRVAQPMGSPATSVSGKVHGGLEISPAGPGSLSVIPQATLQQTPITSAALVDMKKKAAAAQAAAAHHAQMEREQRGGPEQHGGPQQKSGSPNGDGKGLSALDYVKNKIVEEMKKHAEDGTPLVPGQKRASPPLQPGEENSAAKKGKPEVDLETGNAGAAAAGPAAIPPDSPGSPGDMVIDESSETTPKAASPATTIATSGGSGNPISGNPGNANTNANTSKYEPLSDDE